jgi:hypothetical protein
MFNDVPKDKWFAEAIEQLASQGVLKGRDSTWFDPYASISRAEFAGLISRFEYALKATGTKFSDVPENEWYYESVTYAAEKGWIIGDDWGLFHPDAPIRRVEAVIIINRILGRKLDISKSPQKQFFDVPKNYWGYEDIMASICE